MKVSQRVGEQTSDVAQVAGHIIGSMGALKGDSVEQNIWLLLVLFQYFGCAIWKLNNRSEGYWKAIVFFVIVDILVVVWGVAEASPKQVWESFAGVY